MTYLKKENIKIGFLGHLTHIFIYVILYYMSKKKIKPDFSKPKVQKQEKDFSANDFSLENQPDFITPDMEQYDDVAPEDKEYEGLPDEPKLLQQNCQHHRTQKQLHVLKIVFLRFLRQ